MSTASGTSPGTAGAGQSFRPDVVYLHTFLPVPHVYSISPFALKVESFLRVHEIPYEVVYTKRFGSKGQMPYVYYNGEEIDDSNVIIPRLQHEFKISTALSPPQLAVAHAMTRMIEEHTTQIGFYYRYGLHMPEFMSALDLPNRFFQADTSRKGKMVSYLWGRLMPGKTKKKIQYRGLAGHTDEEKWKFSNDDLKALSDCLADKPYFFGGEPTTIDCVLFGHLAQFLYIPLDFPQTAYLREHCPGVMRFMERFKSTYWPDWEELCSRRVAPADKRVGVERSAERRGAAGCCPCFSFLSFGAQRRVGDGDAHPSAKGR